MRKRTFPALVLAGALSLAALPAVAQQTTTDPANQPVAAQPVQDDGFDWGWLGLLGLLGLAGLAGRNRDRTVR